jgi:hypothetical protein
VNVEAESARRVAKQPGAEHQAADGGRALLAERVADDLAVGDLAQPALGNEVGLRAQALLGEPEVSPKDVGDNGISARDVDDRREQLRDSQTRAAEFAGQT